MQLVVQEYLIAPVNVCSLDYRTLTGLKHVRSWAIRRPGVLRGGPPRSSLTS